MRRAMLLALSLMLVGGWPLEGTRGQSSAAPPISLTPPNASPPHASAKSAKPQREPNSVANAGAPQGTVTREPTPPAVGASPQRPNPAADYDGFSASADDSDAPRQVTPPTRAAKGTSLDSQSFIDQDDEALKRKLTICQKCK